MEKNTLMEYGWIVITLMVAVVLLAFSFDFGDMLQNEMVNQVTDIVDKSQEEVVEVQEVAAETNILYDIFN